MYLRVTVTNYYKRITYFIGKFRNFLNFRFLINSTLIRLGSQGVFSSKADPRTRKHNSCRVKRWQWSDPMSQYRAGNNSCHGRDLRALRQPESSKTGTEKKTVWRIPRSSAYSKRQFWRYFFGSFCWIKTWPWCRLSPGRLLLPSTARNYPVWESPLPAKDCRLSSAVKIRRLSRKPLQQF